MGLWIVCRCLYVPMALLARRDAIVEVWMRGLGGGRRG
jgi:hypothetical protein